MTQSIFKYMPARAEFFDNFLLRASNKFALNDPFEVRPTHAFLADFCINNNYQRFGNEKSEIILFLEQQDEDSIWADLGISLYYENGIISLTEKKDSILMWSHYADAHKGIVVEFNALDPFFNNELEYKLLPVRYGESRLNTCGKYIDEPYFHKSTEWQYEKEHRLLLDLYKADVNLIAIKDRGYFEDKKYITINDAFPFQSSDSLLEIKTDFQASIIKDPKFMAMFRVPICAVKSVTFGVATESEIKSNILKTLKKEELKHIKSYQAYIDPNYYSLSFKSIS